MKNHPVRKFFSLTIIYAIVIIGIFILQFKTESVLSKTAGALRISLAQTEAENHTMSLRNQFKANFKGLTVSAAENSPVYGITSVGQKEALILTEFTQPDSLSAIFRFKDGSALLFNVSSEDADSELFIQAKVSSRYAMLSIPYSITTSYNIEPVSDSHFIIAAKNNYFTFAAHNLSDNSILLTKSDNMAKFQYYDPSKRFTYEAVAGLPGTDSASFTVLSKQLRDQFVLKMQNVLASAEADSLNELEITAFVAEKALTGKYNEVIDQIPDSFKKGNKRTYVSTPYFNSLAAMNRSLAAQTERYESQTKTAISTRNLDFFAIDGIADYVMREKNSARIKQVLSFPAELNPFEPTPSQAAGILNVYAKLSTIDSVTADLLKPAVEPCLEVIAKACSLENNRITLSQENAEISDIQAAQIAGALINLGTVKGHAEYLQTGHLIMHSLFSGKEADIHQVAQLYSILAPENTYYPHTKILGWYGTSCAWAWTCANDISYKLDENGVVSINIDFPLNNTHHIIFNGIPNFHGQIEIQGMMFRTDPRFETYNSSGYVYQTEPKTLLIKSRHKSKIELIRLFCDPMYNFTDAEGNPVKVTAKPAAPAPKPAETKPAQPKPAAPAPTEGSEPASSASTAAPASGTTPAGNAQETPAASAQ